MLDPRRQAQAQALMDWIERNGASVFLSRKFREAVRFHLEGCEAPHRRGLDTLSDFNDSFWIFLAALFRGR